MAPKFDFLGSVHLTPRAVFACLISAIPAALIAKLFISIATTFAKGLHGDKHFEGDFTMPFFYFLIYGLAGAIFIWVGAQFTTRFRPFDILFYYIILAICGLALMPSISAFGSFGACIGGLIALYCIGKSFEDHRKLGTPDEA